MRNAGAASCSLELENTWRRRKRQSLPMMISLPSHDLWLFQSTLMLQLNVAELKLKKLLFAGMLLKPPPNPSLVFKIESPTTLKARGIAPIKSCLRIGAAEKLVLEFDPKVPIEKALTPPSSWYTDPSFYALELERVFYRGWQAVGYSEQVKEAHEYFAGRLGNVEYVVCRDDNGQIVAFHNVCRHHGSVLASGTGKKSCFVCPYHGWTYGLDGALRKATRITGIENFNVNEFGLIPIASATWGPFVLLNFERQISPKQVCDSDAVAREWLGSCSETFHSNGVDSSLAYVCRREYVIECNWKVFCDNYLDGGYHVPYAHKGLASGLNLDSYSTTIFEKVSIQGCAGGSADNEDDFARLGSKAFYAFVYPNFMINRYGPWMDTNLVIPLGPRKCLIVFDYFLEASLKDDKEFIERSLRDSERVQMEDVALCESVQRGIKSMAYNCGRYAPGVEEPMHHFHRLLFHDLTTT